MAVTKTSLFLYSVPKISLLQDHENEIAFLGRSNSGKSSLLNKLCQKKNLARISKTPGRTRHAVVYKLNLAQQDEEKQISLVDLPGYGYANMSQKEAILSEKLLFNYIQNRENIKLLLLLLDIRRVLDARELKIINIARERSIKLLLILTKSDKISLSQIKPAKKQHTKNINIESDNMFTHSTQDINSSQELRNCIFSCVD